MRLTYVMTYMYRRCVCTFKCEQNAQFVFVTSGDPCLFLGWRRADPFVTPPPRDFRSLFTASISVSSLRRIGQQQMYAKGRRYIPSAP